MYLTRDAVKATLGTLAGITGPGSELVMDWWFMVDAPDVRSTVLRMTPQMLHLLGEPITFGIHPEDVGAFTARQGWRATAVVTAPELEARFVPDHRHVYPAMYATHLIREP